MDGEKARDFADDVRRSQGFDITAVSKIGDATRESDVIVTATTARTPFLTRDIVPPGAFVAAVGADSPEKSELAPELMANATIVVDVRVERAQQLVRALKRMAATELAYALLFTVGILL